MHNFITVPTAYSFAPSFADGRAPRLFARVPMDDDFVQAECLRLVRAGREEEALDLLEDWCARRARR
ncbi:MAG: hypothetical protein WCI89_00930 [bacterium]